MYRKLFSEKTYFKVQSGTNGLIPKTAKMAFLTANNFFCVFKNTDQNKNFASIVFKAKTKEKYE